MKRIIPTQLILFAVLAALAITGWIYIYSCRKMIQMDLQTITGDASCLEDKALNIRKTIFGSSSVPNTWNLEIGFPSGPVLANISYGNGTQPHEYGGKTFLADVDRENGLYTFIFEIESEDGLENFELPGLQLKDESAMIPDEYYSEETKDKTSFIRYEGLYSYLVEMDGILYFTMSNYDEHPLLYYGSSYETIAANGQTYTEYYDLAYPLAFSAQSGIWAVDDSSGETAENVVPFPITSNPDDPKVLGIYEVEAEHAIVLLTIENKTDLYATVYNTKTKTTQDPVLIFHSDSGDIEASIYRKNDTCPMGSILVKIKNEERECYAVALGKNEMNGNVAPICYDVTQIFSTKKMFDEYTRYNYYYNHNYSEIFYRGEEIWIVSDIREDNDTSPDEIILDRPTFPYSSQLTRQIHIMGVKEDAIFYEGLLSIDLNAADMFARNYTYNNKNAYMISYDDSATWIELD